MVAVSLQLLTLLADVRESSWRESALCAQTDLDAFYPGTGVPTAAAKRICARCEVRTECLADALRVDDECGGVWGVWAGLSADQRRRERARRNRAAA